MKGEKTDLGRIADSIKAIAAELARETHEPCEAFGDSVTVTKDGWIRAQVNFARLSRWVEGLDATHKAEQERSGDGQ